MNNNEKNQISNPNDDTTVLGGDAPTETFKAPVNPGADGAWVGAPAGAGASSASAPPAANPQGSPQDSSTAGAAIPGAASAQAPVPAVTQDAAGVDAPGSAPARPEQPVSRKMGIASFVISIAGASVAFLALILAIAGLVSGGNDGRGGHANWSSDTTISQFEESETRGSRGDRERIEMREETLTREGTSGDRGMRSECLLEESVVEEGAQS